jgi:8-oxo-dGTP diphosphatase
MYRAKTFRIRETCLVIIKANNKVLLIKKLRGLGKGFYNFPGGKVENESPEECAIRELMEEVGLSVQIMEKFAEIIFILNSDHVEKMNVFLSNKFCGELKKSEEAIPYWVEVDSIPYDEMWIDDKIWLPKVLNGEKLKCIFYFDHNWNSFFGGYCINSYF